MRYLTEKEIHIFGIQRTGQHALASWIIGHFDNSCYRNDINTGGLTPPWWYFDIKKRGFQFEVNNDSTIRMEQEAVILGSEFKDFQIGLYSDYAKHSLKMAQECNCDFFSNKQHYILVIRTPWNHWASVLRWRKRWSMKYPEVFMRSWIRAAKEYLGITNNIPFPKVLVKYDSWFSDKNYRMDISKQLGINYNDRGLNIVMHVGHGSKYGSSFDRMNMNNNAQQMNVLTRWKKYKRKKFDHMSFLKQNLELKELSEKIFGSFPF